MFNSQPRRFGNALTIIFLFLSSLTISAQTYTVDPRKTTATVSPTLWGLFFEDINRGADGGLYAEMVKNRSFDFPDPLNGWTTWPSPRLRDGIFLINNQSAINPNNPKFLAVNLQQTDTVGLMNESFNGMGFKKNLPYTLTLRYRAKTGKIHARAFLFNSTHFIGKTDLGYLEAANDWKEQTFTITPTDTAIKGKLLVIFEGEGKADLDRISLFPTDTWKDRPGGLRNDLAQALFDLHPGFLRFPGGCIVEGRNLSLRYQWKKTIGSLQDRQLLKSIWNDDVPLRQTPDYFQSFGLGFLEYFQLCEDIGASPLPILNCGMSCQFDAAEVAPVSDLDPYIQDALDLIEFANGDVHTIWGRRRAELGHPAGFNMKMLGVGNENWGPQYAERLELFTKTIKQKYPYIQIINATGYSRNEPVFHYMDSVLRARHADIIDEHFYDTPQWFMQNANRYDHYDRKGPKIFVGEYAAQTDRIGSQKNVNNLLSALSEAAFMTGLERNADVVAMASYAPLFADVKDWQWTPNLIWFNNTTSYHTPNYYVQQLFSTNKGSNVIPILKDNQAVIGQDSCWASAVIDNSTREIIIKMVNMSGQMVHKTINLSGAKISGLATLIYLSNGNTAIMNTIDQPDNIKPVTKQVNVKGKLEFDTEPFSLTVIKLPYK